MITKEEANKWAGRIRNADWYYNYSDDYGAYLRGQSECSAIRKDADAANLTDEEVKMIIDAFISATTQDRQEYIDFFVERINSVFKRN